jgi:3-phosphoshikimate 1-carboxyvinyltransferase
MLLRFDHEQQQQARSIQLPGSKSISNRYLILNAIAPRPAKLTGLSQSRDTQLLAAALASTGHEFWFEDGATPLRFFMAYAAIQGITGILNGVAGLQKRSVVELAQSLEQAGAVFKYHGEPGFPPVEIIAPARRVSQLHVNRSMSSQFVSALLLMAPKMGQKFNLYLSGNTNSDAYVSMTMKCLVAYGVSCKFNPEGNFIAVDSGAFESPNAVNIEADWSSASYLYSLCACLPGSRFLLQNLQTTGMQGDEKLKTFYSELGVNSRQTDEGVLIEHNGKRSELFAIDLVDNIDLAPALIATCAFLRQPAVFRGLQNLKFKESDRVEAMNTNLKPFGAELEQQSDQWHLTFRNPIHPPAEKIEIRTFDDHRIAMAMSVFALQHVLVFDNPDCVVKSFPGYWNELGKCNFVTQHLGA